MIINYLRLRGATGIMSGLGLEEIELDFRNMPAGVAVLCGANGAGKTTILENLQPYLSLLSRPGSLYDEFCLPNSERFLQAQIGGVDYTFRLVINPAKRTTEAYIWRGDQSLMDGRTTQYGQVLNDLLGDFDTFRRSVFSDQSGESFLSLPRSGRKDFLTRLIGGLERYQDYCERAKRFSTAATKRITELSAQIGLLQSQGAADDAAERVTVCESELVRLGAAKSEAEAGLQNVNEKLTGLREIMRAEAQNAQSRKSLTDQIQAIQREEISVDQQHTRLIAELTAKSQQLKAQLNQLSGLLQERESLESRLNALKSKQAIYQQHKVSAERLRGLRSEEALLNSKIATIQEALNRYKVVVPCGEGLYTNCPLWQGAQRGKPSSEALHEAESRKAEIVKLIAELQQSLTQMREPESLDLAIRGVQDKLNMIASSKATIAQLNERLTDVGEQWTRAEQEYVDRKASLQLQLVNANNTLQSIPPPPESWQVSEAANLEETASLLKAEVDRFGVDVHRCEQDRTAAQERIRIAENARAWTNQLQKEQHLSELEAGEWDILTRAFSREGIPTLKLEHSLSSISEIVNEILGSVFERNWAVSFETQRASADGKRSLESLDVMLDKGGERQAAETLSGGERVWLSKALALAISIYGNRSNRSFQTMFLDESDGALDANNRHKFLTMLQTALEIGNLQRIFLISHDSAIQAAAQARIVFGGGKVETQ